MMTPTVHLNGTSREELRHQLREVSDALEVAIEVLNRAAPHGRDYYPQGPDALRQATREHWDRLARLRAVAAEIDSIWLEVSR